MICAHERVAVSNYQLSTRPPTPPLSIPNLRNSILASTSSVDVRGLGKGGVAQKRIV